MKKQKKTGRRFVQRVKAKKVWGKAVELPEALQTEIHTREPDHVAQLTCPLCGAVRYVTQAQLDFIAVRALRLWLWWVTVMEFDMPFWKFIYYHERPDASHKAGFY